MRTGKDYRETKTWRLLTALDHILSTKWCKAALLIGVVLLAVSFAYVGKFSIFLKRLFLPLVAIQLVLIAIERLLFYELKLKKRIEKHQE